MDALRTGLGKTTEVFPLKSGEVSSESLSFEEFSELSTRELMSFSSMFPFELFPTRVIINPTMVTLLYGLFLVTTRVITIQVKDIKAVQVTCGPIWATLQIDLAVPYEELKPIRYLKCSDAIKARRIITGLIACNNENVKINKSDLSDCVRRLEDIGASS